jgi:ribosome-binding protein aMBF1 (putative translation factor)
MKTLDDLKAQLRQNPEFVREYEALEPEYQVACAVLALRLRQGLSQAELAARTGTKQASVSRVERAETIPSLALLKKLAAALGTRVEIRLVPRDQALGGVTGRGIEQAT